MRWVRLLLVIVFAALTFGGGSFECTPGRTTTITSSKITADASRP